MGVTKWLRERRVGRGAFVDQSNLHRRFAPKPTGGFRHAMPKYHSRFSAWRLNPLYALNRKSEDSVRRSGSLDVMRASGSS